MPRGGGALRIVDDGIAGSDACPTPEVHLVVIWSGGRHEEKAILDDLRTRLDVVDVIEVRWSKDSIPRNYARFYRGRLVPPFRNVEEKKGTGPFLVVTLVDHAPDYASRDTLHGPAVVNTHVFDAKQRYRDWTGPGHLVHGSDTAAEATRDLFFLLGVDAETVLSADVRPWDGVVRRIDRDPSGTHGWESEDELFGALNCSVDYVLLGVDDGLADRVADMSAQGPGIDLLTDNYQETIVAMSARPAFGHVPRWGGRFLVRIGERDVAFNLRQVGDGFFDEAWQQAVLDRRQLGEGGFYRPDDTDEFETALYHALVHHRSLAPAMKERLEAMATALGREAWQGGVLDDRALSAERLHSLLAALGYAFVEPRDPLTVYDFRTAGATFPHLRTVAAAFCRVGARVAAPIQAVLRRGYLTVRDLTARTAPGLRGLVWRLRGQKQRKGFKAPKRVQPVNTLKRDETRLAANSFEQARVPGSRRHRCPVHAHPVSAVKWTRKAPALRRAAFLVRGLLFLGRRYRCPCCGWRVRGFIAKGSTLRPSADGFCPRCNAKARHRRDWLYLRDHTDVLRAQTKLVEIGPRWCFARRFREMPNVRYTGVDLAKSGPEVTEIADVASLPMAEGSFDAALCIHVLEHVPDDRAALGELFRVLRPGGRAIITVPLDLDGVTREDLSITDPEERERLFGERGHVRAYGTDFIDRLRASGFDVTMDPASSLPADACRKFGLRRDENVFHCVKPAG